MTVIEWGRGKAEHLSDSRLELDFTRLTGADASIAYAPRITRPQGKGSSTGMRSTTVRTRALMPQNRGCCALPLMDHGGKAKRIAVSKPPCSNSAASNLF